MNKFSRLPMGSLPDCDGISIVQASATGARETKQDRVLAQVTSWTGKRTVVLAVADGMGGMEQGDRAAEIAIGEISRFALETVPTLDSDVDVKAALEQAIWSANRKIWDYGVSIGSPGAVGSTLVVAMAREGRYIVANVGDSRCYIITSSGER